MNAITSLILLSTYMAGIVYAVGWMKLVAFIIPPYAFYLVAERILL